MVASSPSGVCSVKWQMRKGSSSYLRKVGQTYVSCKAQFDSTHGMVKSPPVSQQSSCTMSGGLDGNLDRYAPSKEADRSGDWIGVIRYRLLGSVAIPREASRNTHRPSSEKFIPPRFMSGAAPYIPASQEEVRSIKKVCVRGGG